MRELKEAGVEAVAVCFLFSFLNPEHEARVAEIVREEFPEAFLSVSSEVLPQYREYERFSTVCLNAYIGPKVAGYVRRLEDELRALDVRTGVHLMTSASGVATTEAAATRPVNLLMSGPVAGVVGGIWAGKQAGYENVITLDVGGTSADIGLAQGGKLRMKHLLDTKVGPYQAMIPMVDVDTIGAGGGSIAYVDQGGIFRVGPRSAGADPGPAAYGRGGTEATATDAMVVLGWLRPEAFLGGGMQLEPDLARKALRGGPGSGTRDERRGGGDGRRPDPDALDGAVDRGELGAQGLRPTRLRPGRRGRRRTALRGADRRRGGDATVLVPPYPGVTAAMGLLATDMVYEYAATAYQRLSASTRPRSSGASRELEEEAQTQLEEDGIPADRIVLQRVVDARYAGQGYELRVDVGSGAVDEAWVEKLRTDFHDVHEREYSRRFEESDIEVPNVRVRGVGLMPPLQTAEVERGEEAPPEEALRARGSGVVPGRTGELRELETRYYDRAVAPGRQPPRGAHDRVPVRLDDRDPAGPHGDDRRGYGNIVIATGGAARAEALEAAEAVEV